MTSNCDVAVIGAGVFGAWTADHLRRAGHRVTLVDMAGPAHELSSSGDESRLTRAAYGPDAIYSRMALASLSEWQALSDRAGLPIFHRCGILFFFAEEEPYFRDSLAVHRQLGLPTEALSARDMAARFPMIDFDGIAVGLYEPQFGALMARRAVQTLVAEFVEQGEQYVQARAGGLVSTDGRLMAIETFGGRIEAARYVFALGSWMPAVFPGLLTGRITPTRQEVFYFAPPGGGLSFLPGSMPGWADFNHGDMFYGMPDLEGRGVKFAHDRHGPVVDPDTQPRDYSQAVLNDILAFRDRRFPGLRGAPLIGARVCQYENSSNGDFLIDRHPDLANVVLVGGGSGHGFKHGPEVGRLAAQLAMSGECQDEPRFSLATKSAARARAVH